MIPCIFTHTTYIIYLLAVLSICQYPNKTAVQAKIIVNFWLTKK